MKKSLMILLAIITTFIFCITAYAYFVKSELPSKKSQTWYTHSSMTATERDAAISAASNWNSANTGMSFSYGFGTSGQIYIGDSTSTTSFVDFDLLKDLGFSATANGACAVTENNYAGFDVFLNTKKSWINGSSTTTSTVDRQGIFTHEFGHALGLGDVYVLSYPDYSTPTMYAYSIMDSKYISFDFRSLTSDDINGAKAVAGKISN